MVIDTNLPRFVCVGKIFIRAFQYSSFQCKIKEMEDIGNPYNIFGAGDRDTPAYLIRRYLYRIFNIANCAHCIAKLFLSPFLSLFFFFSLFEHRINYEVIPLWSFDHLCNTSVCLTINIIFNIYHSPFHDYRIRNVYFWIF